MSVRLAAAIASGIRAERARSAMTQRQLASRLGWSQAKVAAVEAGRTLPAEDLADVCRALGVPLSRILVGADPEDLDALGL